MKEILKKYLDNLAAEDETFAAKYANEKKSIDGCVKYITNEVYKMRKNNENCIGLPDDQVYGMAVHYYDEEDIEVEEPAVKVNVVASAPKIEPKTEPKKRTRKKKAVVVDMGDVSVEVDSDDTDVEFPMF